MRHFARLPVGAPVPGPRKGNVYIINDKETRGFGAHGFLFAFTWLDGPGLCLGLGLAWACRVCIGGPYIKVQFWPLAWPKHFLLLRPPLLIGSKSSVEIGWEIVGLYRRRQYKSGFLAPGWAKILFIIATPLLMCAAGYGNG